MSNNINLNGDSLIKISDNTKGVNSEQKKADKQESIKGVLSSALADGVVSNDELVALAKLDFTVNDIQNVLNNSTLNLSNDEKQKLTDELMIKIDTYRQLNQERKEQDPIQFGL